MFKKLLSVVLVGLVINLVCVASVSASTRAEKEARFAEKVRAGIAKLGTGPEAHARVKLRDKTKLEGYISEADEDHFIVVNAKSGAATTVAYPQVKQVKGSNHWNGTEFVIAAGVVAALIIIIFVVAKGTR